MITLKFITSDSKEIIVQSIYVPSIGEDVILNKKIYLIDNLTNDLDNNQVIINII
jgi:hypothetical protein